MPVQVSETEFGLRNKSAVIIIIVIIFSVFVIFSVSGCVDLFQDSLYMLINN